MFEGDQEIFVELLLLATGLVLEGLALGEGRTLAEVLGARRSVTEGVTTAAAVVALAERLGVDMPICMAVDSILRRDARIDEAMGTLLERPLREETLSGR